MRAMRRIVFTLALAATLISCKKPLMDTLPRWYSRGPRSYMAHAGEMEDTSAIGKPVKGGIYFTALRFPDWAKWREGDFRGAEAVLFLDSTEVAKASAGPRPDPARIRILEGRMWTDVAEGGTTEVFCNGEHRLTIPAEELIKGLFTENGRIHTLGQRPGGKGLCYRIDGEEVFSTGAGTVMGTFMRDTSGVYFVYGIPIRNGDSATTEYHIIKGAEDIKAVTPNKGGVIYDIRVRDGTVYRSERRGESPSSLCLVAGEAFHSMGVGETEDIHLCRLMELGEEMMIKGYSVAGNITTHWIRSRDGIRHQVTSRRGGIPDIYSDGVSIAHLVTGIADKVTMIHAENTDFSIEEEGLCLVSSGSACADYKDGVFAAALSDTSFRTHRIFAGGRLIPLEFNGYFTSLTISE